MGRYRVGAVPRRLKLGLCQFVEVTNNEAVMRELLVQDGAEALAHSTATGIGRPSVIVRNRRFERERLLFYVAKPCLYFRLMTTTHGKDIVEGRL